MKTHTGEKSYQCNQCPRTFAQGGSLKSHMKTHTEGKSYPQSQVNTTETIHSNHNFEPYPQVLGGETHNIGNQWQNYIQANYGFLSHMDTRSNNTANSSDNLEKPLERNTKETSYLIIKRPFSTKVSPYHKKETLYSTEETPSYRKEIDSPIDVTSYPTKETPSPRDKTPSPTEEIPSPTDKNSYQKEESPYPCSQCPNTFAKYNLLKLHMKTHTEKQPYHCNNCPRTFAQGGSLKSHMKTHTEGKSYPQSQVNTTETSNSNSSSEPYLQVLGRKKHNIGNHWQNSIQANYIFLSHMDTHSNNTPNSSDNLKKPLERNTKETPYPKVKRTLSRKVSPYHKETTLYPPKETPFYMTETDSPTEVTSYPTEETLSPRDKALSLIEENPYSREETPSPTKQTPSPAKENHYPCCQCPMAFAKYNLLKSHMKTHTGEKSYQCNQCPRTFAQGGSLKSHMKTHTKGESYPQ